MSENTSINAVQVSDMGSGVFDELTMSDEKLFFRVQRDDVRAFEVIVGRYRTRLYNCIYRMVHNTECAEDLVQETFLRVYRNRHNYKAISNLSTWIYTIALNLARSELRKRKRRQFFSLNSSPHENSSKEGIELPDKSAGPGDHLEQNELGRAIQHAIDQLPEKYKSVIVLRDIEELSYDEIGEILRCPTGTVKSRVNRGRLRLQEMLRQWQVEIL
jgi:RNA polymerase sigma-70 factor (ECF subfamily)